MRKNEHKAGKGPDSCGNNIIFLKTAPNSKTDIKPTIQSECQYANNKVSNKTFNQEKGSTNLKPQV